MYWILYFEFLGATTTFRIFGIDLGDPRCAQRHANVFYDHLRQLVYIIRSSLIKNACPDRGESHPFPAGGEIHWILNFELSGAHNTF